jgi:hypothetical protein
LQDVGNELLYTLHKLTNADTLGFLQHVRDAVPLMLIRAIGEHCEKVEHNTVFKRLVQHPPWPFSGKPLEVCVVVGIGLFLDNRVPCVPCVHRQKVGLDLEHVLSCLIMFSCGFRCSLQGLLELSLDVAAQGG